MRVLIFKLVISVGIFLVGVVIFLLIYIFILMVDIFDERIRDSIFVRILWVFFLYCILVLYFVNNIV